MEKINYSAIVKQVSIISILAAMPMWVAASPAEQDDRAVSGTIVCGGSHFDRRNRTEAHRTTYVFRNFNTDLPIHFNRLTVYDATGAVIEDHDGTTLPLSSNGVLGGGDNSLDPRQSAQYQSSALVGAPLPSSRRPIQLHVEWSSDARALIPEFVGVRTSRRQEVSFDSAGNEIVRIREERGRHVKECRSVEINKGFKKGRSKDKDDDKDDDDNDD